MTKTKEELKEIQKECEEFAKKAKELSDEELLEVTGGNAWADILKKIGEAMQNIIKPVNKPFVGGNDESPKGKM